MSLAPKDHRSQGRQLVLRYAALQLAATLVAALVAGWFAGVPAARATLAGGLVVAVGNVVFGWKLFAPGVAPVTRLARGFYVGEALKWLWLGFALWAALGPGRLAPLPLIAGMLAAQLGFWLGMAVIR